MRYRSGPERHRSRAPMARRVGELTPSAPITQSARTVRSAPDASAYLRPRTRRSSRTNPLTVHPKRTDTDDGRRRASTEIARVRSTTTR